MSEQAQPSRLNEILQDLVALRRATTDAAVPVMPDPEAENTDR